MTLDDRPALARQEQVAIIADGLGYGFGVSLFEATRHWLSTNGLILYVGNHWRVQTRIAIDLHVKSQKLRILGNCLALVVLANEPARLVFIGLFAASQCTRRK